MATLQQALKESEGPDHRPSLKFATQTVKNGRFLYVHIACEETGHVENHVVSQLFACVGSTLGLDTGDALLAASKKIDLSDEDLLSIIDNDQWHPNFGACKEYSKREQANRSAG